MFINNFLDFSHYIIGQIERSSTSLIVMNVLVLPSFNSRHYIRSKYVRLVHNTFVINGFDLLQNFSRCFPSVRRNRIALAGISYWYTSHYKASVRTTKVRRWLSCLKERLPITLCCQPWKNNSSQSERASVLLLPVRVSYFFEKHNKAWLFRNGLRLYESYTVILGTVEWCHL